MENKKKINKEDFEKWAKGQLENPEIKKEINLLTDAFIANTKQYGLEIANKILEQKLNELEDAKKEQ